MARAGFGRNDRERLRIAVLDGDALEPVMRGHPHSAAELLRLAVVDPLSRARPLLDDEGSLHITDAPHWLGPVPERGPFLRFLMLAPEVALELIIGIVETATQRWAEQAGDEALLDFDGGEQNSDPVATPPSGTPEPFGFEVFLDGQPVQLVGDAQVLQWHRGEGHVPTVLTTMLMAVEAWLYRRIDDEEDVSVDLRRIVASRSAALWGVAAEVAAYQPELLHGPLLPLITGGELLIADRAYRGQPHTHLLIAAMGQGAWGERIRSWNTMEHRDRSVFESLLYDVLADGPLAPELQAARERWAQRAPGRLKHLLAQTDLANRQLRRLDDERVVVEYVPPPELAGEVADSNQQLEATGLWLMGPYRMRELLDRDGQLPHEELESLWALASGPLTQDMPADMALDGVRSPADVECGVAAVLVRCGSAWLELHVDAQAWCRERLLAPFEDPPPTFMFDGADAIATDRWDAFCADALPCLWAAAPQDVELRSAVALLLIHRHHATVRRVMSRVAHEPVLATELRRLEHLALVWARWLAFRHERRSREEAASYGWVDAPHLDDLPDVQAPTGAALEAFAAGELSADPPRLSEWVASTPEGLVRTRQRRDRPLSLLDSEYLMAAFDHLLVLSRGVEGDELEHRLRFAEDLANLVAEGIQPDDDGEVSGTPSRYEYEALDRLGAMTANAPVDRAAVIWQPLLAPGAQAEHWVQWFLRALWGTMTEVSPADAGRLLSEMVAFAEDKPTWGRPGARRTDMALALVGLDRGASAAEPDPQGATIIGAAREAWLRWVSCELADTWFAARALRFFATAAAEEVLDPVLVRLAELEPERDASWQSRYDEALGEMLAGLAVRRPERFTEPGPAGEALRILLSRLAERGSALALELVSQLS